MCITLDKGIIFGILLSLHLAFTAYGKEKGTAAAEAVQTPAGRVAWFIITSMPEGLENPVTVLSGDDLIPVTLSKRSRSEPVRIPVDGILKIVRKVENPKDETKPTYLTLAQTLIPEGADKALVILTPAAENPQGLVFDAKTQDLANFRGGDSMYLNMTDVKIGIQLGDEQTQVEPGETNIVHGKIQDKSTSLTIRYYSHHLAKGKWKILSSSSVAIYSTRREICIFSWDPRYKRIDYHGITFPVM